MLCWEMELGWKEVHEFDAQLEYLRASTKDVNEFAFHLSLFSSSLVVLRYVLT